MVAGDSYTALQIREKALQINLRREVYGTFAEIGAGQEVAAQFFKAGNASGSVAKTISAYDMSFSDAIYGTTERYVSSQRLQHMLDREYNLLEKRLIHRAKKTCFFVFANTVSTSPDRDANGHAWVGVRFQLYPNRPPNTCVIHIVFKDADIQWQQDTLGSVGVNLIYGVYMLSTDPERLIISLRDNISQSSLDIDMLRLEGPDFAHIDNRLMSLKLVKNGLTQVAMFGPDAQVLQPSETLHKRNVLLLRGRFRPVTNVSVDMMIGGLRTLNKQGSSMDSQPLPLSELTLNDLSNGGTIDEEDFIDRVEVLCSLGQNVMISNYVKYYKLSFFISEANSGGSIGIVMGYNNLLRLFDDSYYANLRGGILEATGLLFGANATLYIYPFLDTKGRLHTTKDVKLAKHQKLFEYLHGQGRIVDIPVSNKENLHIISDKVLIDLQQGNKRWEEAVPRRVACYIKEKALFGYRSEEKVAIDIEE